MAVSLGRWCGVLRGAARLADAARSQQASTGIARGLTVAVPQSRSFSVQYNSQTASVPDGAASPAARAPARRGRGRETTTTPADEMSNVLAERILAAPASSYSEALRAFEHLRATKPRLRERHFLTVMEKASLEMRYDAVRAHFGQFGEALASGHIAAYAAPKTTWACYQSERLQMHRHVLWAMLLGAPAASRFSFMQRHFRRFELATTRNRMDLYESDALNFLLRMECTFAFAAPPGTGDGRGDGHAAAWLGRVKLILDEMRAHRYRTNYSSAHALFHFLMRRPDVAVADATTTTTEDAAIERVLLQLMDEYPLALERDPRRQSLAVSTAASTGRVALAVALLRDAETRHIAIDAASFAHIVASTSDEVQRVAVADLYMRATEQRRLYEGVDNHSMKNYLLLYAVQDGNFTQIMELLHEMEYNKFAASPHTVTQLFLSLAESRRDLRRKIEQRQRDELPTSNLEARLKECPTVLQLLTNFPTAIDRSTHTGSHAVLQALRAGDVGVALVVLRTTVAAAKTPLRAEVFSQVLYALLASGTQTADVLMVREVERLFDAQHPGERDHLNAQLLNLCESNHDIETMVAVLDTWHASRLGAGAAAAGTRPLSRRALQRVWDTVSKHLKSLQRQTDDASARYQVGDTELSFRGILERYPLLVQLDAWTVSNAIMRSATARLTGDVATLLHVAHAKDLVVEPIAYKAALDVLHVAATASAVAAREASLSPASAREALRESVAAMEARGAWAVLQERYPEFAAKLSE